MHASFYMQLGIIAAVILHRPLASFARGLFHARKQGDSMGFLTAYEGVNRVVVDAERGYWVDLAKHVSQGSKEAAERALSKVVMTGGEAVPTPDVARYRQLMLLASIKAWNLDDDNGTVWPLDLKHVQQLPGSIFDDLWKAVDGQNKVRTPEEDRQFPVEDLGGGTDGDAGAPELFDVPSA
jgi:hypothetical protein